MNGQDFAIACLQLSFPGIPYMMPPEMLPAMNCESCLYRTEAWRDGNYCYMFKDKPDGDRCGQFTSKETK